MRISSLTLVFLAFLPLTSQMQAQSAPENGATPQTTPATTRLNASVETETTAAAALAKGNDSEALRIWQSQARQGECQAMIGLMGMYTVGWGTKIDPVAASKWQIRTAKACSINEVRAVLRLIRPIAESGNPHAQAFMGTVGTAGDPPIANDAEVLRWEELATDKGDAYAQFAVGSIYDDGGKGVRRNLQKAQEWYRLAAAQGNGMALNNLAELYRFGKGVKKDPQEALRWYRLGAEHGDAKSAYTAGWMIQEGKGAPKDDAEAMKWYLLAARRGEARAQFEVGEAYLRGKGVNQDKVEAYKWYNIAEFNARNDQTPWEYVGHSNGIENSEKTLTRTEQGRALLALGRNCRDGEGLPKDEVAAFVFFEWAAKTDPAILQEQSYLQEREALDKQLTPFEHKLAETNLHPLGPKKP